MTPNHDKFGPMQRFTTAEEWAEKMNESFGGKDMNDEELSKILDVDEMRAIRSFLTAEELERLEGDLANIAAIRRRAEAKHGGEAMA